MIRSYFKIAFRNLLKHKVFSFISLLGLSTGIAACMMITYFINYEKSFDAFHQDNIYRLLNSRQNDNEDGSQKVARSMFPMGPTLKDAFPEIREYVRIILMQSVPLQTPGNPPVTAVWCGTDNSFFSVFNFRLLKGNGENALKNPNSIVITEKLSKQLFGNDNPVGKILIHQGRDTSNYVVTGVLEDIPPQSHLQVEALFSMSTELVAEESTNWDNDWLSTYVLAKEGTDIDRLETKFPDYLKRYMGKEKASRFQLFLQPLKDIHLSSGDLAQDAINKFKFNGRYLFLLAVIAFLVLTLAIMNYVNLTTAQAITRAREVAIRKTNGAGKVQIIFQFLGETFLLTFLSLIVAYLLIALAFPLINQFSDRNLSFQITRDVFWIKAGVCIVAFTGLLAGLIPALALANIEPVSVLKGTFWKSHKSPLRNALVVAQFSIAIVLCLITFFSFEQLNFIMDYDTGFKKDNVLVTQISWTERERVNTLMTELRGLTGVKEVTGSLRRIGDPIDQNEVIFRDAGKTSKMFATTMFVDYNYVPFYNIKLLAGRNLSPEYGSDANGNSYMVNETMAKRLLIFSDSAEAPLNSIVGKRFHYGFNDSTGTIVGLVSDFNYNSLHHKVEPLCLTYQHDYYFKELSIRIDRGNPSEAISLIEQKWKEVLPDRPFNYHFLDEQLEQLYKSDQQVSQFVSALTILAIMISCLGLIGLALYNTKGRVKEIAVRKTLGATVRSIVTLLVKDFLRLVMIALLIAIPIAMYSTNMWLQDYAYRVQLSWWVFAITGMFFITVTLLTVSFQTIKAAMANPVKSLRTE